MRRVALTILALVVLAVPFGPPAHAATQAGTLELVGLITYDLSGSYATIAILPATCVHSWSPSGTGTSTVLNAAYQTCAGGNFWMGDTTLRDTPFTLTGRWTSVSRYYTAKLTYPYVAPRAGPQTATGTVTQGGRTGPATLTFTTFPHAESNKATFVGTIQYALP